MGRLLVILSISVMFWNVENFYDFKDDGTGESDTEFSSAGAKHWTSRRFYRKCDAIAKTILWTGAPPDIVAFAEVENRFVLRQLLARTVLRKLDYDIVHYESPDIRGIDCALLYRISRLELVSSRPVRVDTAVLRTRDLLLAQFVSREGDSLAVIVNHHPSKLGGNETDWRRPLVIDRLKEASDSLMGEGWGRILAVGDFNDTPDNPLFGRLTPALELCRRAGGERGSIRFNGQWELIDLAFCSPALAQSVAWTVLSPPFLTERDAAHSGERPLRTYSGPRYLGGVSDHRPILVTIRPERDIENRK